MIILWISDATLSGLILISTVWSWETNANQHGLTIESSHTTDKQKAKQRGHKLPTPWSYTQSLPNHKNNGQSTWTYNCPQWANQRWSHRYEMTIMQ